MPNETIMKFGYPDNLLAEYKHWTVLLRPKQVTAGCVVLACNEDAASMPEVSSAAYAELPKVTADLEGAIRAAFHNDKINYVLLMMVDKHVHWHVIPRYDGTRSLGDIEFVDPGWPKHPDMKAVVDLTPDDFGALLDQMRKHWPKQE